MESNPVLPFTKLWWMIVWRTMTDGHNVAPWRIIRMEHNGDVRLHGRIMTDGSVGISLRISGWKKYDGWSGWSAAWRSVRLEHYEWWLGV